MKIAIRYFSGTGNTRWIGESLADILTKKGHITDIASIEKMIPADPFDLLIIGGPIVAGNCPEHLIRWVIRHIPKQEKPVNALIYTTSAGLLNAFGANALSVKLHKKGFRIIGNRLFVMPRNFYFGGYEPMEESYIKTLISDARTQISDTAEYIHNGSYQAVEPDPKGVTGKDLMAELFSVMARFMGKSFSADDNCTRCGLCIHHCPTRNIELKGRHIRFKLNCMLCTRCIHNCPAHAIRYSGKKYAQYRLKNYLQSDSR